MLVIRRRAGESVFIGDDVEVSILEIVGSQVKLGIRAPREVPVLRSEIRVTAEQNRAASQFAPTSAIDRLRDRFLGQPRRSIQADENEAPE
jgi:carbon storage regulator